MTKQQLLEKFISKTIDREMKKKKRFTPHHNNQNNVTFNACLVSNFGGSNRYVHICKIQFYLEAGRSEFYSLSFNISLKLHLLGLIVNVMISAGFKTGVERILFPLSIVGFFAEILKQQVV